MHQILSQAKENFQKALAHLDQEFSGVHTGRASTSLVENLMIEVYGQKQPLKALAQITVSEATQLTIQPWDQGLVETIANDLRESSQKWNPQNDGHVIRLNLPPMTEERRKELVKLINGMSENTKITVRKAREDAKKSLKKMKDDKNISEDEWSQGEKDLQKNVDDINQEIETKTKSKETDIMKV